ncbi:hypothetical protein N865_10045 [Intrasporangium oryzae NRRL B-24470]|uniref:Uncharacterized protein n=1 Tax=Intrasporangium oryzae NRRL B-24470 TaxID=1386089 RepID=W9G9G9_9MICO|nr:hypothetical protein [Intrasporangium oryzae]EWT01478.1 hypothetical protein N865_10045 [Intrasporangium oryzae NRRL B-24470]
MGFLDKLLGREPRDTTATGRPPMAPPAGQPYTVPPPRGGASSEDERAIARYRYLLRTAPPEDIERVHTEAFGKLSPEQRQMVLQRLNDDLPESERPRSDQPADLARSATRAEMNRPGYLQGAFGTGGRMGGGMEGGMGMGGMVAGSMLGTIAGVVVGSALADMMLGGFESSPEAQEAGVASADGGDASDSGDSGGSGGQSGGGADTGGDAAGQDFAGGDVSGADFGGGDFGGGDFGGDFGGGDFGGF